MALELSLRSTIGLLLAGALALGACDRQSQPAQQANAATGAPATPAAFDTSHKGEAAPDFAFVDADGAKQTLARFKGKPVLLNLWATWCAPCVKELPTLDTLAGRSGGALQVITLSQDSQENAGKVAPFLKARNLAHLRAYRDTEMAFSVNLGVNLPTTILYDSQGRETWRHSGDLDWAGPQAARMIAEAD